MMNPRMAVALAGIRRGLDSNTSSERYRYTNLLGDTAGRCSLGTESGTATAMDSACAVYCDAAITHRRAIDTDFPRFFMFPSSELYYLHQLPSHLQGELQDSYHNLAVLTSSDISVTILTTLSAGRQKNLGSIPGRGKQVLSPSQCADRLWAL
jgi:hypothetical protein